MENNHWKKGLYNYTSDVDKDAWKGIAGNLPKQTNYLQKVVASSLVLLLVISAASLYYFKEDSAGEANSLASKNEHSVSVEVDSSNSLHSKKNNLIIKPESEEKQENTVNQEDISTSVDKTGVDNGQNSNVENDIAPIKQSTSENDAISKFSVNKKVEKRSGNTGQSLLLLTSIPTSLKAISYHQWRYTSSLPDPHGVNIDEVKEPVIRSKKSKWDIYINTQVFSSYHKVKPNMSDDKVITALENPALSWDRIGYRFSAGLNNRMSDQLRLYGGLSYLYQSQLIKYSYVDLANESIRTQQSGDIITISPMKEEKNEQLQVTNQSVGLQLGMAYQLIKRKQYFQEIDLQVEAHQQLSDKNIYGKRQYYLNISYNNIYKINEKVSFKLAPIISLTMSEYGNQTDKIFNLKPYSVGLDIGLIFRIKE